MNATDEIQNGKDVTVISTTRPHGDSRQDQGEAVQVQLRQRQVAPPQTTGGDGQRWHRNETWRLPIPPQGGKDLAAFAIDSALMRFKDDPCRSVEDASTGTLVPRAAKRRNNVQGIRCVWTGLEVYPVQESDVLMGPIIR